MQGGDMLWTRNIVSVFSVLWLELCERMMKWGGAAPTCRTRCDACNFLHQKSSQETQEGRGEASWVWPIEKDLPSVSLGDDPLAGCFQQFACAHGFV